MPTVPGNRDFICGTGSRVEAITPAHLYRVKRELFCTWPAPKRTLRDIPTRNMYSCRCLRRWLVPLDSREAARGSDGGRVRTIFQFVPVLRRLTACTKLATGQENISRAIQLIEQQRGNGGTELLPAIQRAMHLRAEPQVSRNIVLVTDGYVSVEEGVFKYIRENLGQANIFAFGIGDSVNRYLIEGVAKRALGNVRRGRSARRIHRREVREIFAFRDAEIQIRADGCELRC